MMNTRKRIYLKFTLIALVVIAMLSFAMTSCDGYRKYTFNNNFADSSFEYPLSYVVTDIDKGFDTDIARVYFNLINIKPADGFTANINVTVRKTSDVFPNYREFLEYSLGIAQRGQSNGEFNMVERSPVNIDDKPGEKIIYQYVIHNPDKYEIVDGQIAIIEPVHAIAYEAYFEKDSFLWTIEIHSVVERSKQAEADYEHILQTFKFLD